MKHPRAKLIASSTYALPTVDDTRQNEQHRKRRRKHWENPDDGTVMTIPADSSYPGDAETETEMKRSERK
jgi:hypothetical protein